MRVSTHRDRAMLALIVALHALGLWMLLSARAAHGPAPDAARLSLFDVAPAAPPPPATEPHRVPSPEPEGASSPPNIRSTATPIVAPPPIVPLPPFPVIAAPVANTGFDPTQGAAERPGPGTGAGGEGDGFGSGRFGDGTGGGGAATPPRWRSGTIRDRDYPRALGAAGVGGAVEVRYLVGTDGRVSDCTAERSSGTPALDAFTCALITRRFRFHPSRDETGRPVAAWILETHDWVILREPAEAPGG